MQTSKPCKTELWSKNNNKENEGQLRRKTRGWSCLLNNVENKQEQNLQPHDSYMGGGEVKKDANVAQLHL